MFTFYRKPLERGGSILRNERGILLVSVAMVFAVAAVFVAVAATRTTQDTRSTAMRTENIESFFGAHAGEQAMKAAIRQDAETRFAVAQNAWIGTGAILNNPQAFFANQVTIPGVRLPNGVCFDTVTANLAFINADITTQRQVYNFQYTITSQGVEPDDADRSVTVVTNGNFQIQVDRQSFANYALFTNTHTMTSGTRVWFTDDTHFSGRVHTNTRFCFAYNPTFSNGLVSQVDNRSYFYNNGSSRLLDADHNAPNDVPVFGDGFSRGASTITLPPNAFDQLEGAVGGPASTNLELTASLGLTPSTSPPPTGVYVPNDGSSVTGGIYIQGDAQDILMYVDASDRQCYSIRDDTGATTSIVIDAANNQTIVDSVTYNGTPNGALFTDGNIDSLGGPNRSYGVAPPAVQSDAALSVFADGDIKITRDLVYSEDPLVVTDAENVLGIFTPGGDVRIGTGAPDNITIHSTLMTSDGQGVVTVDNYNYGSYRGEATILGGVIASYYGAFFTFNRYGPQTGFTRNFVYDQRLSGGLAPPFFPTTSIFMPATSNMNQVTWTSQRQVIPGQAENFQMPSDDPNFNPDFSAGAWS